MYPNTDDDDINFIVTVKQQPIKTILQERV